MTPRVVTGWFFLLQEGDPGVTKPRYDGDYITAVNPLHCLRDPLVRKRPRVKHIFNAKEEKVLDFNCIYLFSVRVFSDLYGSSFAFLRNFNFWNPGLNKVGSKPQVER